jgi:hypothetical protein
MAEMARNMGNSGPSYRSGVSCGKAGPSWRLAVAQSGIIFGSIQLQDIPPTMEAERINALSALLNDMTSREAELRRYL